MIFPAVPLPARMSLSSPVSSPMPSDAPAVTFDSEGAVFPVGTYPPSGIGVPFDAAVMSRAPSPSSDTEPSVAADLSVMRGPTSLFTSNTTSS